MKRHLLFRQGAADAGGVASDAGKMHNPTFIFSNMVGR